MKNGTIHQIIVGVLIWATCQNILLLAGAVLDLLPAVDPSDVSTITPYLLTLAVSILVTAYILLILKRRKKVYYSNYPHVATSQLVPAIILGEYEITMYDVKWEVMIGSQRFYRGDLYPFVKGPFCPADHYTLDSINEPTIFGSCRTIWRCGSCGARYPRQRDQYLREASIVGKKVLADHITGNVENKPLNDDKEANV